MKGLVLNSYIISDAVLKNNLGPNETINLMHKCSYMVKENDEDKNRLHSECAFMIHAKRQKKKFSVEVVIKGDFTKTEDCAADIEAVHKATFDLLYPYLRMYILNMTTNAGLPPLILPIQPIEIFTIDKEKEDVTQ